MRAFTASWLFTPLEQVAGPTVLVEDGIIVALGPAHAISVPANVPVTQFPGAVLAPGLVDIHTHGANGHDIMEATPEALSAIEQFLSSHGVTSYCPTTVTAPIEFTISVLERLAHWIDDRLQPAKPRACPLGIHMEGPFLSHVKRGVQPDDYLLDGSLEVLHRFWRASRGRIVTITIAPEVPNGIEIIREAVRLGICVSLGHSNADSEIAHRAIAAGARHATHTFNGMRALDHRDPGILGAILAERDLTAEIIADGVHVHPDIVKLFLYAKGSEHAVLVTDSISATGQPDGSYRLGTFQVQVTGNTCLSADGRLAGSVLTLDRAVQNVVKFAGCDLQEAIRLATLNPARVLGKESRKGVLRVGADADMVVLTPSGEVIHTIIGGKDASSNRRPTAASGSPLKAHQ
jgi:N-acetylglucosamine-6-phosphate deacetylase